MASAPPRPDPWEVPEWRALHREASLIRQLLGSGATALGRANYADGKGEYYNAFFGLSAGVERLAKLILVVEHAVQNSGNFPPQKAIKDFGHQIAALIDAVAELSARRELNTTHMKPTDKITNAIIECLDGFADAKKGRYANFGSFGDPNVEGESEPIRRWWTDVATLILREHFEGTAAEARVTDRANEFHKRTSHASSVLYFDEQGSVIRDVREASIRTGQTEFVQKYGRVYVLRTVRWLAEVFEGLSDYAVRSLNMDAFFGHSEYLRGYLADDAAFKRLKRWPII